MEKKVVFDIIEDVYRMSYAVSQVESGQIHLKSHDEKLPFILVLPETLPVFANGDYVDVVDFIIDQRQIMARILGEEHPAKRYMYLFGTNEHDKESGQVYFHTAHFLDFKSDNLDALVIREWDQQRDWHQQSFSERNSILPFKYWHTVNCGYRGTECFVLNTGQCNALQSELAHCRAKWQEILDQSDYILRMFEREKAIFRPYMLQIFQLDECSKDDCMLNLDEINARWEIAPAVYHTGRFRFDGGGLRKLVNFVCERNSETVQSQVRELSRQCNDAVQVARCQSVW